MTRFTGGWIKLHRDILEKELLDNIFLWGLWHYLLHIANYKPSQIIWQGTQRTLLPGQCLMKIREISDRWECSPTTIWKWLHYLSDSGRIAVESRTHGTIVTICNWKEYQNLEEQVRTPSEHQVNTKRTPSEHEVDYSEESKNKRKKERTHVGIRLNYPPEFETLWVKYGRRGDKKKALEEFNLLKLSLEEVTDLEKAIAAYCAEQPELQYRLHFCRFLKTDWRENLSQPVSKVIDISEFNLNSEQMKKRLEQS